VGELRVEFLVVAWTCGGLARSQIERERRRKGDNDEEVHAGN
jgi:hypothetical protein